MLFDVDSMPDYGELSRPQPRGQRRRRPRRRRRAQAATRPISCCGSRRTPSEPGWPSPVGPGPSRLAHRVLGDERALSRPGVRHPRRRPRPDLPAPRERDRPVALRPRHARPWPTYWLHNGFLQVEGQKMSKSLGNFITIHELLETEKFGGRKWPGEVLRLAMLMTHYREPIDFSVKRLEEAENEAPRLAARRRRATKGAVTPPPRRFGDRGAEPTISTSTAPRSHSTSWRGRPLASTRSPPNAWRDAASFSASASTRCCNRPARPASTPPVTSKQPSTDRLAALNARDFANADAIRAELADTGCPAHGLQGRAGERATKWEMKR